MLHREYCHATGRANLPLPDLVVAWYMALRAVGPGGELGLAWPSSATIAANTGMGRRTALRALARLRDAGWLVVAEDRPPGASVPYLLAIGRPYAPQAQGVCPTGTGGMPNGHRGMPNGHRGYAPQAHKEITEEVLEEVLEDLMEETPQPPSGSDPTPSGVGDPSEAWEDVETWGQEPHGGQAVGEEEDRAGEVDPIGSAWPVASLDGQAEIGESTELELLATSPGSDHIDTPSDPIPPGSAAPPSPPPIEHPDSVAPGARGDVGGGQGGSGHPQLLLTPPAAPQSDPWEEVVDTWRRGAERWGGTQHGRLRRDRGLGVRIEREIRTWGIEMWREALAYVHRGDDWRARHFRGQVDGSVPRDLETMCRHIEAYAEAGRQLIERERAEALEHLTYLEPQGEVAADLERRRASAVARAAERWGRAFAGAEARKRATMERIERMYEGVTNVAD